MSPNVSANLSMSGEESITTVWLELAIPVAFAIVSVPFYLSWRIKKPEEVGPIEQTETDFMTKKQKSTAPFLKTIHTKKKSFAFESTTLETQVRLWSRQSCRRLQLGMNVHLTDFITDNSSVYTSIHVSATTGFTRRSSRCTGHFAPLLLSVSSSACFS